MLYSPNYNKVNTKRHANLLLTLNALNTAIAEFANTLDPDEKAVYAL